MWKNCSAIIHNNTLLENNVSWEVYNIWYSSTIQLNYVAFTRNKLTVLLRTRKCCSAIIWNNTLLNTLLKNNISIGLYHLLERSTMQLNNVTFTRNKLRWRLLEIELNSSAIIQNNPLLENNFSSTLYYLQESSTIQLNHGAFIPFIRNKLMRHSLFIILNSNAIIQNNILLENNFSETVYDIQNSSTIQFIIVAFIRNALLSKLLDLFWSSGKLINNTIIGNSLDHMFFAFLSWNQYDLY